MHWAYRAVIFAIGHLSCCTQCHDYRNRDTNYSADSALKINTDIEYIFYVGGFHLFTWVLVFDRSNWYFAVGYRITNNRPSVNGLSFIQILCKSIYYVITLRVNVILLRVGVVVICD